MFRPHSRQARISQIGLLVGALLFAAWQAAPAAGQGLLEGEFGDIDLGRQLVEPAKFPSIRELRQLVARPEITTVLTLRLFGDANNHHIPIWSSDGQRLAFQRTSRGSEASQLLVFSSLADEQPKLISPTASTYDLMFRWGLNNPASFVFARIDAARQVTEIQYSADGETIQRRTSEGQCLYPSLFERTDGVRWLAYERDGRVVHQAWTGEQTEEQTLMSGTSPSWSLDGRSLLAAREGSASAGPPAYQVVVRNVAARPPTEVVLPAPAGVLLRSPTWSPDQRHVACYARDTGDNTPWRILVCPVQDQSALRPLGADVVVNPSFRSEGPSWEATSRRLWFFSHQQRQQEYFPIVAADIESGRTTLIDYPKKLTTPFDLAVSPAAALVPELALVAHSGVAQDLYILLLNHY